MKLQDELMKKINQNEEYEKKILKLTKMESKYENENNLLKQ